MVLIPLTYFQSLPVLGFILMFRISKKSLFGDEYCLYIYTVRLGLGLVVFFFSISAFCMLLEKTLFSEFGMSFLIVFLLLLSSEHRFLRVLSLNLTEFQCSLLSNSQTHSLMHLFKLVPLSE